MTSASVQRALNKAVLLAMRPRVLGLKSGMGAGSSLVAGCALQGNEVLVLGQRGYQFGHAAFNPSALKVQLHHALWQFLEDSCSRGSLEAITALEVERESAHARGTERL